MISFASTIYGHQFRYICIDIVIFFSGPNFTKLLDSFRKVSLLSLTYQLSCLSNWLLAISFDSIWHFFSRLLKLLSYCKNFHEFDVPIDFDFLLILKIFIVSNSVEQSNKISSFDLLLNFSSKIFLQSMQ